MKTYLKTYLKNFDYPLFITYVVLVLFGLVMVYSASIMVAIQIDGRSPDYYFNSQKLNIIIGFIVFFIGAFFPYKHFKKPKLMMLFTAVIAVLFIWLKLFGIGEAATGSKSWINIFGITTFQPSELAKLFVILYMSATIYNKSINKNSIKNVAPIDLMFPIIIWGVILGCVGAETDLGAAFIIGCLAIVILMLSGIRGKTFLNFSIVLSICGGVVALGLAIIKWDSIFNASRMGRFQVLGNPFEYAQGSGYQIINGYLAIGAGGLKGVGLGQSIQKLGYLPEPQTDYIMAIIAEEIGIKGVALVIFGIGFIVCRALFIAMKTQDPLARMIAGGIGGWIGIQAFVNLGGISGLIPLTGVTLPFISYGGSSILILSLALGILMNISMFYKREKKL